MDNDLCVELFLNSPRSVDIGFVLIEKEKFFLSHNHTTWQKQTRKFELYPTFRGTQKIRDCIELWCFIFLKCGFVKCIKP